MPSSSTQVKVALDKSRHPENYCPVKGCLWRVRHLHGFPDTPCKRHPPKPQLSEETQAFKAILRASMNADFHA